MPVTILHTRDGRLDAADAAALKALGHRLAGGGKKVLLHLHGGLVNEASGVAAATRLSGTGDSAFNVPSDWEQIYVVWRTGALETLRTNWRDLFENDRLYRTLLKRLISLVSKRIQLPGDDGRAVSTVLGLTPDAVERRLLSGDDKPFEDVEALTLDAQGESRATVAKLTDEELESELKQELEIDEGVITAAADIEAALAKADAGERSYKSGDALAGQRQLKHLDDRVTTGWRVHASEGRSLLGASVLKSLVKHGAAVGLRVFKRYRSGRDHGLHATVVEELVREFYGDLIGSIIWGMMKSDAGDHFKEGALGAALIEAISKNAGGRLLLTGHSAGSIWASEFILAAAKAGSNIPLDLVFLAPAVRTSKFAEAIAAGGGDICNFRLFAMSDKLEREDVLLGKGYGFLYPSSLLYLVSGICEEHESEAMADAPLLGLERHLRSNTSWLADASEGSSLKSVHTFLAAKPNRSIFSVASGGAGLNTNADSHGGFDDNKVTLESVATFFP